MADREPREIEAIPQEVSHEDPTAKHHARAEDREAVVISQQAGSAYDRLVRRYRRVVDWIMGGG